MASLTINNINAALKAIRARAEEICIPVNWKDPK